MANLTTVASVASTEINATKTIRVISGPSFYQHSWILVQVITSALILGAIWAFVSLVTYATKTGKWNRSDKRKSKTANLLTLAALCPVMFFLQSLATQSLVIVDRTFANDVSGDRACEVVIDASVVLFSFSTSPAYFFLWYRQKMLYSQPSLKHLNTRTVRFFSYLFLVLLLFGGMSSCFIHTIPVSYQMSNLGCVRSQTKRPNILANLITVATLILSQVILLGLFCHPLRLHKSNTEVVRKASSASRNSTASSSTKMLKGKGKNKEERVYKAIRKATVSMLLCVSSDISAVVMITMVFKGNTPMCLSRVIYDISLFTNIVSVMFCFEEYSKILVGVCVPSKYIRQRRSTSASMKSKPAVSNTGGSSFV